MRVCTNTRQPRSPDTLFLRRYLSRVDSMHHKQAANGTGELTQLMMTGISGVRTYLGHGTCDMRMRRRVGTTTQPYVNEMLRCLAGTARAAG